MHANLIDSSHILRVILLVKAPISTSPTRNEEEILINKDLERFYYLGVIELVEDSSSGAKEMQVRILSPRLN